MPRVCRCLCTGFFVVMMLTLCGAPCLLFAGEHGEGARLQRVMMHEDKIPWRFLLRGMVAAGVQLAPLTPLEGGELELSYCLSPGSHGYERSQFSIGPYTQVIDRDVFLGGSLIVRGFSKTSFLAPEFRFRGGQNLMDSSWFFGVNGGIAYAFDRTPNPNVSGFIELGSIVTLPTALTKFWIAAGMGVHF